MKRLDGYLVRSFVAPFIVATFAMVGLFIVAEILTHMNRFVRHSAGLAESARMIGMIYLLKTPNFFAYIAPMTILVGGAFGLTQLSKNNELTAMKACGVSLLRVLVPVFGAAVAISALAGVVREFIAPHTEQKAIPLFYKAVGDEQRFADVLGVVPEPESTIAEVRDPNQTGSTGPPWRIVAREPVFHASYSFVLKRLRGLKIVFELADGRIVQVDAARARHNDAGEWQLEDVTVDQRLRMPRAVWRTTLLPKDLSLNRVPLSVRPLDEVIKFVRAHPEHPGYRVLLLSRLAYPLTGIVLLMLGLPLVLGNERLLKSNLLGMGAAVVVCLLYFGVQFFSYHLGQEEQLPPSIAVLAPPVLGIAAGAYLLDTLRT